MIVLNAGLVTEKRSQRVVVSVILIRGNFRRFLVRTLVWLEEHRNGSPSFIAVGLEKAKKGAKRALASKRSENAVTKKLSLIADDEREDLDFEGSFFIKLQARKREKKTNVVERPRQPPSVQITKTDKTFPTRPVNMKDPCLG